MPAPLLPPARVLLRMLPTMSSLEGRLARAFVQRSLALTKIAKEQGRLRSYASDKERVYAWRRRKRAEARK